MWICRRKADWTYLSVWWLKCFLISCIPVVKTTHVCVCTHCYWQGVECVSNVHVHVQCVDASWLVSSLSVCGRHMIIVWSERMWTLLTTSCGRHYIMPPTQGRFVLVEQCVFTCAYHKNNFAHMCNIGLYALVCYYILYMCTTHVSTYLCCEHTCYMCACLSGVY